MTSFPDGFLWGAATSAYQIEGSPLADGAGASIWHRFAHTPGTVTDGSNGDIACDSYRRWHQDVALLRELGIGAYRFSISWPRVMPSGRRAVNPAGLDHYDRVVDALCAAGIKPFVTLYHWDLPGDLQDEGGWANRDCAGWFADYAATVVRKLGDRVQHWITLNEPTSTSYRGYLTGDQAPGMRDAWAALRAVHHLLLAHGRAVDACRSAGAAKVGISLVTAAIRPASSSAEDGAAAERLGDLVYGLFFEPIFKCRYADGPRAWFDGAWPDIGPRDMETICSPIDFLGVNYYFRASVRHDPDGGPLRLRFDATTGRRTDMGWEVYPEGLFEVLASVRDTYGNPPVFVTENGAAFDDSCDPADRMRSAYLADHVAQVRRALDAGADVRGYFVWSLLDNFEWSHGHTKKFGIASVDSETMRRSVKPSGRWYSSVAMNNAIPS